MAIGAVHRGDLLRALSAGAVPEHAALRLFGFEALPEEPAEFSITPVPEKAELTAELLPSEGTSKAEARAKGTQLRFWCVDRIERLPEAEVARRRATPDEIVNAPKIEPKHFEWTGGPAPGKPLVEWSRLWPFLREILGHRRPGRAPDVRRLIQRLASGKPVDRIPRRTRRAWLPKVQIWLDRRPGLAPFWDDYDDLMRRLTAMRGSMGLEVVTVEATAQAHCTNGFFAMPYPQRPNRLRPREDGKPPPLRLPDSSATILVLGDLGQFEAGVLSELWLRLGRRLRRRAIPAWALCPCPRTRWRPELTRVWSLAAWDRGQPLPRVAQGQAAIVLDGDEEAARRDRLKNLLVLAGPAVCIERGLLRDLRLLLPASQADAGTEYDAMQQPDAQGGTLGITLPADQIRSLRAQFAALDAPRLRDAVRLLRRHHAYCGNVFGHMEVVALEDVLTPEQVDDLAKADILPKSARDAAQEFWRSVVKMLAQDPGGLEDTVAFAGRDWDRLQDQVVTRPEMQAVWALANRGTDQPLPPSVQPETVAWLRQALPRVENLEVGIQAGLTLGVDPKFRLLSFETRSPTCVVSLLNDAGLPLGPRREIDWRVGARIEARDLERAARVRVESGDGSFELAAVPRPYWATRMYYDNDGIRLEVDTPGSLLKLSRLKTVDRDGKFGFSWIPTSPPPPWAQSLVFDEHGLAADVVVGGASFLMRWVPPGKFRMGSPAGEAGRWDDHEGPQHEVELTRGFWLGETPVTQAQWRSVVAAMPRGWFDSLRGKKAPLKPAPSHFTGTDEAPVESVSWEECAAFASELTRLTDGALVFGLPSEAQWEYACRAGTYGAFGDGSDWTQPEGKDPALERLGWYTENSGGRTHAVKGKTPNDWGLYDMHGNVWEWCRDGMRTYQDTRVVDPEGEYRGGRVVRGGSWSDRARLCRAAYRDVGVPGGRGRNLGFRLAAGLEFGGAERPKGPTSRPQPPRTKK